MYERNAIVLERYFNQMFGYDMKNNIKTNFKDYCELVDCFEKYSDITDEEDNIMQEYDLIANKIRDIQKKQEMLGKRNNKYQQEREELFQNIDENSEAIQKKFLNVNSNIQSIDEQIRENVNNFIDVISEFNEKSNVRTECGRNRRSIENEYNKKLNKTLNNYKEIDVEIEKKAKQFIDVPTDDIEDELKEKIQKNGEKEKIPFDMEVITKAITLCVDVQKRETEILANIYDKTNKLFTEIKSNATKGDKHKKIIKDSKSKLEFVGALKEYLVQFLDNERLTAVNGAEEHKKLMKEACENLDADIVQINNLYTLLLKEISKKITKKSYTELYNINYLKNLEKKSEEFERQIKKLNLPVTIINPNYWRIEGMKRIYDVFYKTVTEEYGRDLSEYMPNDVEDEYEEEDKYEEENSYADLEEQELFEKETKEEKNKKTKRKIKGIENEEKLGQKTDDEIDMILGFDNKSEFSQPNTDDEWEDDEIAPEDDFNEEDDDVYYDIWGKDIKDDQDEEDDDDNYWEKDNDMDEEDEDEEDWDDEEYEDEEDYDEEDWEDEEYEEENDDDEDYGEEDDEWDEEDEDEWEDEEIEEEKTRKSKVKKTNNEWENEFVKIDERNKSKRKKGFFDKFKK